MSVTIKRNALTMKRPVETLGAESVTQVTSGAVLSTVPAPPRSWTLYAIAGVIGTLFMTALIFLQFLEYAHYKNAFQVRISQASETTPRPAAKVEPTATKPAAKVEPAAVKPAAKSAPAAKAVPEAASPAEVAPSPDVAPAAADTNASPE